ncbi:hypothetical protein BU046_11115 [Staphylococcus simulans]|uniref:replication/maintenance protein RepL n=1 Tax=Staphylococcus simulans TaxID=1286 RepID=UPI000D1EE333|nr:replication/maintenance protein RepL [Staphylococcus simulans]PTJ03190.1 hypothetical protein BU046_11115 [Staphylococcus simulans]
MSYQLTNLKEYSAFNSVEEMDNIVSEYNKQLKKPHYETLNLLKQYSCKVIGVSHIKIKTISKKNGKSTRTVKNHLKYLKEHGYISVINTTRAKRGGKGSNVYVINPIELQKKIQREFLEMSSNTSDENKKVDQTEDNT